MNYFQLTRFILVNSISCQLLRKVPEQAVVVADQNKIKIIDQVIDKNFREKQRFHSYYYLKNDSMN